jgi:hypothetical protein
MQDAIQINLERDRHVGLPSGRTIDAFQYEAVQEVVLVDRVVLAFEDLCLVREKTGTLEYCVQLFDLLTGNCGKMRRDNNN